jgi:hypothetical protein
MFYLIEFCSITFQGGEIAKLFIDFREKTKLTAKRKKKHFLLSSRGHNEINFVS